MSAVAYNSGTLNGAWQAGAQGVQVFDGAACGWASHKDTDKATGMLPRGPPPTRGAPGGSGRAPTSPRCDQVAGVAQLSSASSCVTVATASVWWMVRMPKAWAGGRFSAWSSTNTHSSPASWRASRVCW